MKKTNTRVRQNGSAAPAAKQSSKSPNAARVKRVVSDEVMNEDEIKTCAMERLLSGRHIGVVENWSPEMGIAFLYGFPELHERLGLPFGSHLVYVARDGESVPDLHHGNEVEFTVQGPPGRWCAANVRVLRTKAQMEAEGAARRAELANKARVASTSPEQAAPSSDASESPEEKTVEPWKPYIPSRRSSDNGDNVPVLASPIAMGSIPNAGALDFLCLALSEIDHAELRKAILAAGLEDYDAVDLMEVMHVAWLFLEGEAMFPGCLALPGITSHMEITLDRALSRMGHAVYKHRALLLKLMADRTLSERLAFVDALGIAESVARRNGDEIEYTANGEEAVKVLALRMRADLLLGRVSQPEQRAAA